MLNKIILFFVMSLFSFTSTMVFAVKFDEQNTKIGSFEKRVIEEVPEMGLTLGITYKDYLTHIAKRIDYKYLPPMDNKTCDQEVIRNHQISTDSSIFSLIMDLSDKIKIDKRDKTLQIKCEDNLT